MEHLIKNIEHASTFELAKLVEVEPGRVNSLTLSQQPGCKVTVFAIDTDEGMASHAAGGDAMVLCLEGKGQITINDEPHVLEPGQAVVMSAGSPHSVKALEPFKMLLTVVFAA